MDRSDSALSNRAFAPHRAVGAPPAAPTSPAPATDPAPAATVPAATVPAATVPGWPDLPAPTDIAPAYPDRVDADPDGARPAGGGPGDDRPTEGRWVRPALAGLLLATALLYLCGLGASGWANSFYSAAAQAGSVSWKAMFFGSSDAGNSITVDKTPAALWVMTLSVRIFGLNSWAILVPQALAGVASVGVLFATVRRWYGPAAGLLAAAVLAATPVATLMFRFNNPDALLVLLLVLGAYSTVRAVETATARWIMLAGALVGLGYLTKMLQAFLVVPVFAGTYLLAAPIPLLRRIRDLLLAGLALLVAGGWWVAIVELLPAGARPYIGGSQTNSILDLTFGYNGLGRITGAETGSVGGGGGQFGPASGQAGWLRLFGAELGGQVSWLLPAALILLVAGLALAGRAARTDRVRAGLVLWGGWLLVTGLTFSFMQGIFHAYYTVALAPAIGALVGIGVTLLGRRRRHLAAAAALAGALAITAGWAYVLLGRSPDWNAWLRPVVLVAGLMAAAGLLVAGRLPRWAATAVLAVSAAAAFAAPAAYALDTAATPHTGSIPSAGPVVQGGFGPGGPGGRGGPGGHRFPGGGQFGNGQFPGGGQFGNGQFPGGGQVPDGGQLPDGVQAPGGVQGPGIPGGRTGAGSQAGGTGQGGRTGGPGGMGGLLDSRAPSAAMTALLTKGSDRYTWVAATVGSNNASGYQLATGKAVLPVGGFNGSDPSPTLAQFQRYVRDGRIHYFIGGGGFRANGGSQTSQEIASWVASTFSPTTVDGETVYDLSTGQGG